MVEKQPNSEGNHPDKGAQKSISLSQKDSFDEKIEQILANFNEKTADLTKLQTQIISLVKKYSQSDSTSINGKNIEVIEVDEKLISENIFGASVHLMEQRANIIKNNITNSAKADSEAELISKKSKDDFKRIVKSFVVYVLHHRLYFLDR